VFVEFAGAVRILQNSIVFVNDIVLLSQGLAASWSQWFG
jgi:hypothetical protein